MKEIIVTVAPDGSTKVEASGFTGTDCTEATRRYRQGLGQQQGEVVKAEAYAAAADQAQAVSQ